MAISHLENYYAFRYNRIVVDATVAGTNADVATLAAIESLLQSAHDAYWNRRYQEAVGVYQTAAAKIYNLIDPQFDATGPPVVRLPVDAKLFAGLLSAAAEYLNILPVKGPGAGPRSRIAIDPSLLGSTALADSAGINSSQLGSASAQGALADYQLAKSYEDAGMPTTAAFFAQRAKAEAPNVVGSLEQATHPPPSRAIGTLADGVAATLARTARVSLPSTFLEGRSVGTAVAGKIVQLNWAAGAAPPTDQITASIYQARVSLQTMPDALLAPQQSSDLAIALPHDYYYVIPLGLAECYHALGDYPNAETQYLQAASYQFLNATVEAPYVWIKLASLYLDWGNALFKNDQPSDALPIYSKVLTPDMKAPASQLYTLAGLKPAATLAQQVIAHVTTATTQNVNPQIAAVIVGVREQLLKIAGGLDFWGIWPKSVPIWTFEYLQQVAINFAQLAIGAEQSVISFWDHADQSTLTRRQLADAASQSQAEANAAQMQVAAAQAQAQVYADGVSLAQQRASDAQQNAAEYQRLSAQWIVHQALQSQLSGGDDGDSATLNSYADQMMSGSYSLSDGSATLAAAEQLTASRLNREYEVDSLKRQAQEMGSAVIQAQDEQNAANAQVGAAQAALDAASLRASNAQGDLAAFDAERFSPDVWSRMGDAMFALYQRYFTMAIKAARLMQQAYNFETDQSLHLIRGSYATNEVNGLLGADALMADIQGFTYDLISSSTTKPQPLKQTISLAERHGFAFEAQFRKTGTMDFTTSLDDFDMLYPGTYAGRIESVECAVQGIVPPTGVSGILTNSGISVYRLPSANWNAANGGVKVRVQPRETLVLSDYSPRSDALVASTDARMMRTFEGAGVASTWRLEIPPSVNDLDYGAITDVQLTISYKARYDPGLHNKVAGALAGRPGAAARQRGIPLRWIYPDAFYAFQSSGLLTIGLAQKDFAYNERSPVITSIGIVIATVAPLSAGGLKLQLASPAHPAAIVAPTDANGAIDSTAASSPWAPLASGTALGTYTLAMTATDNPSLVTNGKLSLAGIANIALVLGYSYTPRA